MLKVATCKNWLDVEFIQGQHITRATAANYVLSMTAVTVS